MTPFLTGLTLGFASSAHCAAMCGPLVLAAGRAVACRSRGGHAAQLLLHHAARILIYALLALPAGAAGATLAERGFARELAIAAGAVLLVTALGSSRVRGLGRVGESLSAIVARASTPALRWSRVHPVLGPLLTGALNGMLPCGLVYGALTTAAAAGSVPNSVLLMIGFGLGTSAVLLAISTGAAAITPSLRLRLRPLAPIVLVISGAILIARGVAAPHGHGASASRDTAHLHSPMHD